MKSIAWIGVVGLMAGALSARAADSTDVLKNAAKKLGEQANYSWIATPRAGGGGGRFQMTTEGKAEKDGFTYLVLKGNNNTVEAAMKGSKRAAKLPDEGWQSQEELAQSGGQPGPGMFLGFMLRNFKAPAAQAEDLINKAKDLKEADGAYSGELPEAAAKELLSFRRPGGDGQGPEISGAKGSAKFWVKDGMLTKYEFTLKGHMSFGDREMDIDRTTTVEIKEVGSTKVQIPDEAKKKLG